MKKKGRAALGIVLGLALLAAACAKATPTPTPTATPTPTRTATAGPGAGEPSGTLVIPVNKQVEHEAITVGVKEVVLSSEGTTLRFWHDCGPHEPLEALGSPELVVDGVTVLNGEGGGGKGCDPSEIKEFTFPPVPPDANELYFQHGPFWGPDRTEMVLELPIGSYLSELDPKSGGEVALDIMVEFQELAYRFTKLSAGVYSFSLLYQPANEEARWRPLMAPGAPPFIEDDRGHELTIETAGMKSDSAAGFAIIEGSFDFGGSIDTRASVWKLRVPQPGKIFRGPWEFHVDLPYLRETVRATVTPTPTSAPTRRATATPTSVPATTSETPPLPQGPRLAQALSMVPLEFGTEAVEFADYASSRKATGLEEIRGIEDMLEFGADKLDRLYEGLALPETLRDYAGRLRNEVGLDLFGFDLGVWSFPSPVKGQNVMVLQGPIDSGEIAEKLLALEYKRDEHSGTSYYWLHEDFKLDIRHPLRQLGLYLNRIAMVEDRLLAAPATDMVKAMIDTQHGRAPSLLDSKPHRALAEAVGEGLLSGVFVTPRWIVEAWTPFGEQPITEVDMYLEGPDRWGLLSAYDLVLLGYRVLEGREETVVALHYPNAAAAENDAEELEKRWNSFRFETGIQGHGDVIPVRDLCSPFTTRVIAQEGASVLVGTCPVLREEEPVPYRGSGPNLWTHLFSQGELHFLARELEELKSASEQK